MEKSVITLFLEFKKTHLTFSIKSIVERVQKKKGEEV